MGKIIILLALLFSWPLSLSAQDAKFKDQVRGGMENTGKKAGYEPWDPGLNDTMLVMFLDQIVPVILSFIGMIFFIFMIYAGILWMTSGGGEEKVTKAKKIIKNSVIGVIVVIAAYAITELVLSILLK